MLFLRSLWKIKYYFLAATAIWMLVAQPWKEHWIMTVPAGISFFSFTELLVPFVVLLPVSFLLYNNYEIELALVNGVTTMKLMLCKFFAIVVATVLPLFAVILPVQAKYYYVSPEEITIPIYVPEHFKLYLLFSALVTILFFASLFLLLRVVLRNCYAPVGLAILAFSYFQSRNQNINCLSLPLKSALFDPFITKYLIGDTVANEGFVVSATGEVVKAFPHLWTYNRLLFFGIAVVLLVITCCLLRKEKLHESFGD